MSVINNNILAGAAGSGGAAAGYEIKRSLRFNSADSAYLNRTPASAGNRKTWTWSGWVKRCGNNDFENIFSAGGSVTTARTNITCFFYQDDDATHAGRLVIGDGNGAYLRTEARFRDPSSWGHLVIVTDTTLSTANDRIKVYWNGVRITDWNGNTLSTNVPQNSDLGLNTTERHTIGNRSYNSSLANYSNLYLADINFVDGQALAPTDFGEYDDNGVWQPIEYTGTYGTNGFYLDFSDNSSAAALGYDAAGSNNWTVNNISVATGAGNDSLLDSPANGTQTDTGAGGEVSGNYATWNPLFGENLSLSNGNLKAESTSGYAIIASTLAMTSGKWYMEYKYTANSGDFITFGVSQTNRNGTAGSGVTDTAEDFGFKCSSASFYSQSNGLNIYNYSSSVSSGDVISLAFDADAGKLWVAKNGTWMTNASGTGDPANGINPDYSSLTYSGGYFFMAGPYYSGNSSTLEANFGQRAFAYTAPSGYKALCTTNLDDPTLADGSTAMDVVTYAGNNSTQSISGLGFSPDLVWLKRRSGVANHHLYDIVRGATKRLQSSTTNVESTAVGGVTSFDSDGWTMGNDADINGASNTFVGWTWDAGTSTVSNTDGSITSSVRANPSAGFSIVSYTGTGTAGTVGHGLNAAPKIIIFKNRDAATNWRVYTTMIDASMDSLFLNTTAAKTDSSLSAFTSSVFYCGTNSDHNGSGQAMIAYCFAPVAGYSAFGSYTGNGSTDGPFVYTGFRPAFILVKRTDSAAEWVIQDSTRDYYNGYSVQLYPSNSNAEGGPYSPEIIDYLSNGFKLRSNTATASNGSGGTFIYIAFAENPFKYARAR